MAYCQYCGKEIPNDSKFCPNCGAAIDKNEEIKFESHQNTVYTSNVEISMSWYKFLIYFALFFSAFVGVFTAYAMMTGSIYGGMRYYIYAMYPSLKTYDIFMGILSIGYAIFAIIVRQKLAHFKSDGPNMLLLMYTLNVVMYIVYIFLVISSVSIDINSLNMVPSLVMSILMIVVNKIYFDKRKHLFVK